MRKLIELKKLAEEQVTGGRETAEEMLRKDDDLALRRRGHRFIPGAHALTLEGRRPARRCDFSCSAVMVEPPQSAEIDLLEAGAAAASAAMSTILLAEGALALEVPLEARLGAMACVRCKRGALRGKEMSAGETEKLGNERADRKSVV